MNNHLILPQKKTFNFDFILNENTNIITFDSNFDSGNCSLVQQLTPTKYNIHTANDCSGLENEGYSKSWFYFSVFGFPNETIVEFNVWRINMLYSLRKYPDVYKPVYKTSLNNNWKRIEKPARLTIIEEKLVVIYEFEFKNLNPNEKVFFAFSYPFSYEENQIYLNSIQKNFLFDNDIYLHKEILIKSPEERNIDLVTITSHEGKLNERESFIKESLFPQKKRPFKFRDNKPVILLTARVHPGETPSSHAMNGIIKFLLDKNDGRSYLLKKFFVFLLIPMINPDGVYNGYYRMDIFNQNLNRYYKTPKITKQPAIFAIRNLVEHLKISRRLIFYCDLHAHSARKGCFLFGNAINDFVSQVESQIYAKIVSLNCINFEYNQCIFSKKHMSAKDRFEKLTKEGCGRVVIHKLCNLVHSYTLECGFHLSSMKNHLSEPSNKSEILNGKFEFKEDYFEDINNSFYQNSNCYFNIEVYENVGKSLLISFLDIFEKNPYTRIKNSKYKQISQIRKEIAQSLICLDRFKKQPQNFKKLRNINEQAYDSFFHQFKSKKVFDVPDNFSSLALNVKSHVKKNLAKSSSFKEKDDKRVRNTSFKTPEKKKIFNFQSKFDNFQVKSESNLLDEGKNEIWEKEKEEEDLLNELKEEFEEGVENSDVSYDSEELDDEAVKTYSHIKQFKSYPEAKTSSPRLKSQNERIKERQYEDFKEEIISKNEELLVKNVPIKNKPKSNEFEKITKSINYPPFLREKKKNPSKSNIFNIRSRNQTSKRSSLNFKNESNGIGVFGKNQWILPNININNLNAFRQKQIEQEKLRNSRKIKV